MMKKLNLTFLSLVFLIIQPAALFGQHSQLTRSDASTAPGRIAFISDIGGGQSLYVVDPEQSDIKVYDKFKVPEQQRKIVHESIVFSPNKKQVVFFASAPFNAAVSLWIAKADGSSARKLIDWKWPFYPRVVWSPAGDCLAFVITKDNSSSVYAIKSDGSDFHFVANGDNFSWSPNGHQRRLSAMGRRSDHQQRRSSLYAANA
jgi:Tol biopolymer transport system component